MMIDEIYKCRQGSLPVTKTSKEWDKLCIKFEDSLNGEQIDMFHKLLNMQSETTAEDMRSAYRIGFKDGVRLIVESLE